MLKKSFGLIWSSFGYFITCMGLDVAFFFALGFFTAPFSAKMKTVLLQITAIFSKGLSEVDRTDTILDVLFGINTIPYWKEMSLYLLFFILITYVIYVIFQSITWNLSLRIINKKIKYVKYLKSFAVLNLFWFLIFILYNIIDFIGDLRVALADVKTINVISIIANFFLLVLLYFTIISYTDLRLKQSFIKGWKKYKTLLSRYVIVLIYFFILNLVLSKLFLINYTFAVVIGLVLFVPALTWARVFLALSIERAK